MLTRGASPSWRARRQHTSGQSRTEFASRERFKTYNKPRNHFWAKVNVCVSITYPHLTCTVAQRRSRAIIDNTAAVSSVLIQAFGDKSRQKQSRCYFVGILVYKVCPQLKQSRCNFEGILVYKVCPLFKSSLNRLNYTKDKLSAQNRSVGSVPARRTVRNSGL